MTDILDDMIARAEEPGRGGSSLDAMLDAAPDPVQPRVRAVGIPGAVNNPNPRHRNDVLIPGDEGYEDAKGLQEYVRATTPQAPEPYEAPNSPMGLVRMARDIATSEDPLGQIGVGIEAGRQTAIGSALSVGGTVASNVGAPGMSDILHLASGQVGQDLAMSGMMSHPGAMLGSTVAQGIPSALMMFATQGRSRGAVRPAVSNAAVGTGLGVMGVQSAGAGIQAYRAHAAEMGVEPNPLEELAAGASFATAEILFEKVGLSAAQPGMNMAIDGMAKSLLRRDVAGVASTLAGVGLVGGINMTEEQTTQIAQNLIETAWNPDTQMFEGVDEAGMQGLLQGVMMGGGGVLAGGVMRPERAPAPGEQVRRVSPEQSPVQNRSIDPNPAPPSFDDPVIQAVAARLRGEEGAQPTAQTAQPPEVDPADFEAPEPLGSTQEGWEIFGSQQDAERYAQVYNNTADEGTEPVVADPLMGGVGWMVRPARYRNVEQWQQRRGERNALADRLRPMSMEQLQTAPDPRSLAPALDPNDPVIAALAADLATQPEVNTDDAPSQSSAPEQPSLDQDDAANPESEEGTSETAQGPKGQRPTTQDVESESPGSSAGQDQPSEPPAGSVRESWQMTKAEWWERDMKPYHQTEGANKKAAESLHRADVEDALKAGKPVPPEVLADYPDLKPKAAAPEAAEPKKSASKAFFQELGKKNTAAIEDGPSGVKWITVKSADGAGAGLTRMAEPKHYRLDAIHVPKGSRNKGLASRLLKDITEAADVHGMTLGLQPIPLDKGDGKVRSASELRAWYRKNGFEDADGGFMVRTPKEVKSGVLDQGNPPGGVSPQGSGKEEGPQPSDTQTERGKIIAEIGKRWQAALKRFFPENPPARPAAEIRAGEYILNAIETGQPNDYIVQTDNKAARAVFTELTGVKLPKTQRDTKALFTGQPFGIVVDLATGATSAPVGGGVDTGGTLEAESTNEVQDQDQLPGRSAPGKQPVLPGEAGVSDDAGAPDAGDADPVRPPGDAGAPAGSGEPGGVRDGATARPRRPRGSGNGTGDGGSGDGGRTNEPGREPGGRSPESGPRETTPVVQNVDARPKRDVSDRNHRIAPDDVIAPNGVVSKIRANVRAIQLLKKLESEDRNPTPAEKSQLAQYSGWGPVSQALDRVKGRLWQDYLDAKERGWGSYEPADDVKKWAEKYWDHYKTIRDLVGRDEFEAMSASTRNAHYTSKEVIAQGIWPIVQRLGFTGGRVLETSAGIGHMIGIQPEGLASTSDWTAVELDSISARILRKLYPEANVLHMGFQDAPLRRASFDLMVGNVPFASDIIDDGGNTPKFSLHNYFFARSIDLVRPGGLIVAITSTSTMDNPSASRQFRAWAGERADLLGSIRLPNTAFNQSANTSVTTDIIILRKKDGSRAELSQAWLTSLDFDTGDGIIPLNEYFEKHPEMMLGKMTAAGTMYGKEGESTLEPTPGDLGEKLAAAIKLLPENVTARVEPSALSVIEAPPGTGMYGVYDEEGTRFFQRTPDGPVEFKDKKKAIASAYVNLRDQYKELVAAQQDESVTEAALEATRKKIRTQYEAAVEKHGRINERPWSFLSDDPDFNKVASLELVKIVPRQIGVRKNGQPRYRPDRQITPAPILTQRTQFPFKPPEKADNATDAIAISEFYHGSLQLPYIASLLGMEEAQAQNALLQSGEVFIDPASGLLTTKGEYLSGHVRSKLEIARKALETDPGMAENVRALEEVQPEPVGVADIQLELGATWVPTDAYEGWINSRFGSKIISVGHIPETGQLTAEWTGRGLTGGGKALNEELGTSRIGAIEIIRRLLVRGDLTIYDTVSDENGKDKQVKNDQETIAARAAGDALKDKFGEWVKQSEFATNIADVYNQRFNGTVARVYNPPNVKHYPGASSDLALRPHQKVAVTRGVKGSYLNGHGVGLGKTFVLITTAMEWRRLGLAKKPLIVVQNSTVGQFAASFQRLYPSANVLVPTEKDMEKANRGKLLNRVVTGNWDAVVVPHSMFNKIEISGEYAQGFIQSQIDHLETAIATATRKEGKKSPTVKNLQKRIDSLKERLKALLDGAKDKSVLRLDEMGIDGLLVDEAHAYKKTFFFTEFNNIRGLDTDFSKRGLDMLLKVRYVQETTGNRNIVLATGTPITNTLAEAWTMMRYVRPDILEANGITHFDDFASAFAEISTREELDATNRFRPFTRMRRFKNVPELQAIWREVSDTVRAEDLAAGTLDRPELKGGRPTLFELEPTPATLRVMDALLNEYKAWEKLKGREKREKSYVPLVISTQARKASVDMRLIQADAPPDPGNKLFRVIYETYQRWNAYKDDRLTQVIFLDLYRTGEPGQPGYFNAFEEIRRVLMERGVPKEEIAIIGEYDTNLARESLFDRVNKGEVRVVMGSTETLGVGVNIQQRLQALHHIDAPWRPSDMEQREGRIVRQGNEVPQITGEGVEILRYGVKRSFDAGQYERLARKQKMINDVLTGKAVGRTVDDLSEEAVASFAEASAAFSGNPDLLRRVELGNEIQRLELLKKAFIANKERARRRIDEIVRNRVNFTESAEKVRRDGERYRKAFADPTKTTVVAGSHRGTGEDAIKALNTWGRESMEAVKAKADTATASRFSFDLGAVTINGIDMTGSGHGEFGKAGILDETSLGVRLDFGKEFPFSKTNTDVMRSGRGLFDQANELVTRMVASEADYQRWIVQQQEEEVGLRESLGRTFERQGELDKATAELNEVLNRLREASKDKPEGTETAQPDAGAAMDARRQKRRDQQREAVSSMSFAERSKLGLLDRMDTYLAGVRARANARMEARAKKRGTFLGMNRVDPRDLGDSALFLTALAAQGGVKVVKGGRALSKFIAQNIDKIKAFDAKPHVEAITKVARAMLKGAVNADGTIDQKKLAGNYVAATRKETKQRDANLQEESKAPVVEARAESEATSRAAEKAIRRQVKQAVRDTWRKAAAQWKVDAANLIRQARGTAARRAELAAFKARVDKAGAVEAERIRFDTIEGLRKEVARLANELPAAVRANFLNAATSITTPLQLVRTINRMRRSFNRWEARQYAMALSKLTKPKRMKRLTDERRKRLKEIAALAGPVWQGTREEGVSADALRTAADALRGLWEDAMSIHAEDALERRAIKGLRGKAKWQAVEQVVKDVKAARKKLKSKDGKDANANALVSIERGLEDLRNVLQTVEGRPDGVLHTLMWERPEQAEEAFFSGLRGDIQRLEVAVRKVGFKNLSDAMNKLGKAQGEASRIMVEERLGGNTRRVGLGDILELIASSQDPSTMELIEKGMPIQWDGGLFQDPMNIAPEDIVALWGKYRKYQPLIDGIRAIRERQRPQLFRVFRILKGFEPTAYDNYWTRRRNLQAAEGTAQMETLEGDWLNRKLENAGFGKERGKSPTAPIVIGNIMDSTLQHFEDVRLVIHMAIPIRDAADVLYAPQVRETIAQRFGPKWYRRLQLMLAHASRANRVHGTRFARVVAAASSNLAVARLATNPPSALVQSLSVIRFAQFVPMADIAWGVANINKISIDEIMKKSGYAWDRYTQEAFARFSPVVGKNMMSESGFWKNAGAAGRNAMLALRRKDMDVFWDAVRVWRTAGQNIMVFMNQQEALAMRALWMALRRQADREHPNWERGQRDRWISNQVRLIFRETQNGSSPLDSSIAPTLARDSGAATIFMFTSDLMKSRNRIIRAFRRSKAEGIQAATLEATNILAANAVRASTGFMIAAAIVGVMGGDWEDIKRLANQFLSITQLLQRSAKDVVGTGLPIVTQWGDSVIRRPYDDAAPTLPVQDSVSEIVRNLGSAARQVGQASTEPDKELNSMKFVKALERGVSEAAALAGVNPFQAMYRRVMNQTWKELEGRE